MMHRSRFKSSDRAMYNKQPHSRSKSNANESPLNCVIGACILLTCCCLSFTIYGVLQIRSSIPSRGHTTQYISEINEGGDFCFAPNSMWYKLKNSKTISAKDGLWMGGTDPKLIIMYEDTKNNEQIKSIWKPQLPISEKHRASAQNEVLYFHIDCLLQIKKTPPAITTPITFTLLQSSITKNSEQIYISERNATWDDWKKTNFVVGTSQYFYPKVTTINPLTQSFVRFFKNLGIYEYIYSFLGASSATVREISQRDMLDFICGNWDRAHNQFYIYDSFRNSGEIIFLDHNHLRLNKQGRDPFSLSLCKFWKSSVDRLQFLVDKNLTQLALDSLHKYEEYYIYDDDLDVPIRFLQTRAETFLNHVDNCISEYGEDYVFTL